ncbi:MAG: GDP-mannose 4,6-dehydratase [Candidatus Gastranaerophilales bacterium]|nr:GDP-mannose 4,6-dehydratase [Candidatus Gastranaerophilales bacterium]
MKQKTALITGITGQDGGYLAKLLLAKGYNVVGLNRRGATNIFHGLEEHGIKDKIELRDFELLEYSNICRLIKEYQPEEFYNLAAQSFVSSSWIEPIYTIQANEMGVAYILEAIREFSPDTKLYQASTSEMFGQVQEIPQNEDTPFYPKSPYGIAKLAAHWLVVNYRESYGLHASSGILFNHESPFRGKEFVTRKITDYFAKKINGKIDTPLELGNVEAKRDWGYAGDYVEAMWLMLQQNKPDTFVISTGKSYSIKDFVNETAKNCNIQLEWIGEGQETKALNKRTNEILVSVNDKYYRPAEVEFLIGNPEKAKKVLNWKPKIDFKELCKMMIEKDIERNR